VVEHRFRKAAVTSSTLVSGSIFIYSGEVELPAGEIERAWKAPSPIRASVYAALAAVVFWALLPKYFEFGLLSGVVKILVLPFLGGCFLYRSARGISSLLVLLPAAVVIVGLHVYVEGSMYALLTYGEWGLSALDPQSRAITSLIAVAELAVLLCSLLGGYIVELEQRRSQSRS
jgi:hypothetical protein